ncbi:MAG: hypothetical protein FWH12_06445 [Treponema sp.]|nr:hypothetical protein [Treponema sp.]
MNEPQVTELEEAQDNVEIVRDQLAAILSLELQNQFELAKNEGKPTADYDIKIYVENSRPYDTIDDEAVSLVNIVLQEVTTPHGNPRMGAQKSQAIFHLYCTANGNTTGDFRDDQSASFRAWRIMRLVRRILMSEQYTYLGMRKTVTSRTITKMEAGTPNVQAAQAFTVIRAHLEVQYTESYIGGPSAPFEGYDFEVSPDDGQVIAKPSLIDRVTGLANNNSEEE